MDLSMDLDLSAELRRRIEFVKLLNRSRAKSERLLFHVILPAASAVGHDDPDAVNTARR